ncbi:hypothetical protein ACFVYJ_05470 [Pontibacter sp. JAM-7]|uniref:hypothetical protein n=1 Tax=Pontibacter sp. JAM-7 TaxID=3366581 RepID=UPI003AF67B25
MMLTLFADSCLLVCALLLAGQSYRNGEQRAHTASFVISLAAAFIAIASLGTLVVEARNQDLQTLQRILDNLAFYAALPLLGTALLSQAWQLDWSRAGWGRWLLALFALFELMRRSELGNLYSQIVTAATLGLIIVSLIRLQQPMQRYIGLLALVPLTPALLIFSQGSLMPEYYSTRDYAFSLALGLLMLAWQQRYNPSS